MVHKRKANQMKNDKCCICKRGNQKLWPLVDYSGKRTGKYHCQNCMNIQKRKY